MLSVLCSTIHLPMKTTSLYYALFLALFAASCGSNEGQQMTETTENEAATPAVTLEPKSPGANFPDAAITDWSYQNGKFNYTLAPGGYQLGVQSPDAGSTMCANSAEGQHIHLIVDNEPYIAKYNNEFEHNIADGEHYILSFLSRSYHESIKTDPAHRAVKVNVSNNSFSDPSPIAEPMLFYSRPKGTYVGKDAENILVDFYPVNAPLGAEYQVKAEIAGETFMIDQWQPYIMKGLPMGDHTLTLTLVDAQGMRIEAPLNPVSRTFTLQADPAPQN